MLTIDASVWVAADPAAGESHVESAMFLAAVLRADLVIHQPAICLIEVSSALARRTGDSGLATRATADLLRLPGVVMHPIDIAAAMAAADLTAATRLRAADGLYASVAREFGTTLVTLDRELVERAREIVRVMTPGEWLSASGSDPE